MEIRKAIEVLNEHAHRGITSWEAVPVAGAAECEAIEVVGDRWSYNLETNPNVFTAFEAIAIASAYIKDEQAG